MKHVIQFVGACALTLCLLSAMAACTDSPSENGTDTAPATAPSTESGAIIGPPIASTDTAGAIVTPENPVTTETPATPSEPSGDSETAAEILIETDEKGNLIFPDDVFE